MDQVTQNVSDYIKKKNINLSAMSRETGIKYMSLYNSLLGEHRGRELRGWELLTICNYLEIEPQYFWEPRKEKERGVND